MSVTDDKKLRKFDSSVHQECQQQQLDTAAAVKAKQATAIQWLLPSGEVSGSKSDI